MKWLLLAAVEEVDRISTRTSSRTSSAIRRGKSPPIGANELLIAAQAVALGHTLVTDNEREFARVPDLRCENWLRPAV